MNKKARFEYTFLDDKKIYFGMIALVIILIGVSLFKMYEINKHTSVDKYCKEELDSYKEDISFFCCYYCKKNFKNFGNYISGVGCYCGNTYHKEFDDEYFGKEVFSNSETFFRKE